MRMTTCALLTTLLFATVCGAGDPLPSLDQLAWMSGSWQTVDGERRFEEHWTTPGGGLMLGMHRDLLGTDRVQFEYLRIEARPDGIVYLASPGGRSPTPFRLTELEDNSATFTNPEHDFPQRIRYWIDADGRLCARAEAGSGEQAKGMTWCWSPV